MVKFEEAIEIFKRCYKNLKNEFYNQKHDLFLLKDHVDQLLNATSNFKMNETISFSSHQQQELVNLLANIRKLIESIEKEIEIQEKEEFFNSNNNNI